MYPLDTIKTRAQLNAGGGKINYFQQVTTMWRQEGIRNFYRGILAPLSTYFYLVLNVDLPRGSFS
jgi:hypothetical protein